MRVIWVIAGDETGGVAQAVRGLTAAVHGHGIEPAFISLADGQFCDEMRQRGKAVEVLGNYRLPTLAGSLFGRAATVAKTGALSRRVRPALATAIRRARADAVHVLWPNLMPLAAAAAKDAGVPCFWEMPNILGRYPLAINRRITQWRLQRYGVLPLANSAYTAATLGSRPVEPVVMHLGADGSRFRPGADPAVQRAELGIPEGAPVFAIAARLTPEKGQLLLLQATASLPQAHEDVHLLLIGGPMESEFGRQLRHAAAQLGMADCFHLVGHTDHPERYYAAVDVAVNARVDPEPFGLSVVEAMLCAKPVLVHALGGPAETVIDGVTGWHVKEPTVEAFKAGILRALADRPRWAEMGAAARARALEHFTLERQAEFYAKTVKDRLGVADGEGPA